MRELNVLADRLSRLEEGAVPPGADRALRERFRTIVCCLGLTLIVMSTRPGLILADTKIDMAVNPMAFLGRAFHLWDPEQFGQLQNQAVGYLFPMGPFFLAGHLAGLAPWIVQRFWLALLLCLAFVGAQRLARRLGIGGPIGQLLGGLAYALGPHGISALGMSSWEYLPLAMLPWIMLPLVAPGSLRRAAALSGLAVACCGGINATATVAMLVVPFLFLVLRRAWRLTAWWSLATVLATAWWLVPLALTGRYGFSWLPYTEKAATTTSSTGLLEVLRGTERWANRLTDNGVASLPLGNAYTERPVMILLTVLMAALGVAGLLRGHPHRVFLISTLLAGVAIITAGHAGPLAPGARQLLDGPLAALRNLYKFDAVVRLPLALGLAHLLTSLTRPRFRLAATVAATLALAGVALPALAAGTAGAGAFRDVPGYWRDAANWLNQRAGHQGVVALPGSRFGEYEWGRPMDDLVQPLLTARWGVRQLVPQGSPGYARIMNEIDQRVSVGEGSAGLTEMLARMGVRYLLIRNDLDRSTLAGAWPARVHAALDGSPGIRRAAVFGPQQGTTAPDDGTSLFDQPYPAVEIYEVQGAASIAQLVPAQDPIRLAGGPEAMFGLADSGLLGDRAVLLDQPGPGRQVVSDAQLKRLRGLGQIRTQLGPVRTRADTAKPPTASGPDPSLPGWDRYETVAAYAGIKDITASSSNADAGAVPMLSDAGRLPYAAFDGSTATQWQSSAWTSAVGQWIQVEFTGPRELSSIQAAFIQASFLGPPPSSVSVETETGKIEQPVTASTGPQGLRVPAGPTRWVRIKVTGVSGDARTAARVAISEITIPGLSARRSLELPPVSGDVVVMSAATGAANPCMKGPVRWVCSSGLERGDSELGTFNRDFTSAGGQADVTGRAVVTDGELISRLLGRGATAKVSASSTAGAEPAMAPQAAFDNDPSTSWISSQGDQSPTLIVNWPAKITVGTVTVGRGTTTRPQPVTVQGSGGQVRHAVVDGNGLLEFAPMTTDRLLLIFKRIDYPVQIASVDFPGAPRFHPADDTPVALACGQGPTFLLNGRTVRTSAQGTLADLMAGRAFTYRSCSPAKVASGRNELDLGPGGSFRVESAVFDLGLGNLGLGTAAPAAELTPAHWGVADRTVDVDAVQASYLVVNENFNQGWRAELGGRTLTPVTLDGWKQAWAVPAGAKGTVRLTYVPDGSYRLALGAGAALLLVLLAGAFLPERPARTFREPAGSRPAVLVAPALGFWSFGLPGLGMAVLAVMVVLRLRSAWLPAGVLLLGAGCAVYRPDLGELFPQLASVAVLAALCAGLRPGAQAYEGLLDQVVARRGDPDRQQRADGEVDQQVPGIGRVVGDGEPDGDHDELPEEDPVGDLPEEGHHPVPQDR